MSREEAVKRGMRQGPGGSAGWARLRAAAVLLVLTASPACTPLDDAMVAIFGRSMRDSRALDPYEQPVLPAENAVPFAVGNYPAQLEAGAGVAGASPAGGVASDPYAPGLLPDFPPPELTPPGSARIQALANPAPVDEESVERGRVVYDRYCAVCHGPAGLSADAPILPKLPLMAAWNLATGTAPGYSDGYIFAMIREGRGAMPAYGHSIPYMDRWHVVNYVRFLQQQATGGGAPAGGGAQGGASTDDTAGTAADTAGGGGG